MNPYTGMVELFKRPQADEAACKLVTGSVKSTAPLIINAAGLENEEDDILFVNEAPELAAGDSVLMLTTDYQKFYIIGRITTVGRDISLPSDG